MIITLNALKENARELITVFEDRAISSLADLERLAGTRIRCLGDVKFVDVDLSPSQRGTRALTVSYTIPKLEGVPIQLRFNKQLDYTAIIVKARELVRGYDVFARDPYGNIVQYRKLETVDFAETRKELERVRDL